MHFGINSIGLINVYAKDVALLPDWQQKICAGYNLAPDGGVSEELLASQARARPARTDAPDPPGLRPLAKDLARLTADSFDAVAIQKRVKPPSGQKWGSLKSLEKLLATQVGADRAREVMAPLFGIYERRLADAHLSGSELDDALKKVSVDTNAPYVVQGYQLLHACADTIRTIITILGAWTN